MDDSEHTERRAKEWLVQALCDVWTNVRTLTWKAASSECGSVESGITLFPMENVCLYLCKYTIVGTTYDKRGPTLAATSAPIKLHTCILYIFTIKLYTDIHIYIYTYVCGISAMRLHITVTLMMNIRVCN